MENDEHLARLTEVGRELWIERYERLHAEYAA